MAQNLALSTDKLRAAANADEPVAFRSPPHNIEAEQALLGAVLVNNEAMDRVSGFLDPVHFYDPLHGQIYEIAAKLIHAGKQATPITLRTFFENAEPIDSHLTVPQYLGRLAANATTIINAYDYGRTVYDLAVRRQLIVIGEDMVNVAYDSPIDLPPETQIQEAEGQLYSLAESGKYGQGFQTFGNALVTAIDMANNAFMRRSRSTAQRTAAANETIARWSIPELVQARNGLQERADREVAWPTSLNARTKGRFRQLGRGGFHVAARIVVVGRGGGI